MIDIIIYLVGSMILCMTVIEIVGVNYRQIGSFLNRPMIGVHISTIILLGSRVCTAIILMSVGYLADVGVSYRELSLVYGLSGLMVFLFFIVVWRYPIILTGTYMFGVGVYHSTKKQSTVHLNEMLRGRTWKLDAIVVVIGFFSFFGFLMPSIMAVSYPDNRGFLLQTGFVFNVIATVLSALTAERKIAQICDSGDKDDLSKNIVDYSMSKAIGILISGCVFFLIAII